MITITKDMEVGIALIDTQHRELVNRINAIIKMGTSSFTKEESIKTIDFLGEYIVKHFNDEEELMRQASYPALTAHKQLHLQYMNDFKKLKAEFLQNGQSAKFTLDLTNSVIGWIVKHIKHADREFGKYNNAR